MNYKKSVYMLEQLIKKYNFKISVHKTKRVAFLDKYSV